MLVYSSDIERWLRCWYIFEILRDGKDADIQFRYCEMAKTLIYS